MTIETAVPVSDSIKLAFIADWFDKWDAATPEERVVMASRDALGDESAPPDDVQQNLRRMALSSAQSSIAMGRIIALAGEYEEVPKNSIRSSLHAIYDTAAQAYDQADHLGYRVIDVLSPAVRRLRDRLAEYRADHGTLPDGKTFALMTRVVDFHVSVIGPGEEELVALARAVVELIGPGTHAVTQP